MGVRFVMDTPRIELSDLETLLKILEQKIAVDMSFSVYGMDVEPNLPASLAEIVGSAQPKTVKRFYQYKDPTNETIIRLYRYILSQKPLSSEEQEKVPFIDDFSVRWITHNGTVVFTPHKVHITSLKSPSRNEPSNYILRIIESLDPRFVEYSGSKYS